MADDNHFINWAKLTDFQVYNAAMMKPNSEYDFSIIELCRGEIITPESVYQDTVSNDETLNIRLFTRKYDKASLIHSLNKKEFTRIMYDCVKIKPPKFVWEHEDFDKIFKQCIIDFCDNLNKLSSNDLFVRSGKSYVLSKGEGLIYSGDIIKGAFSGLTINVVATSSISSNATINITIPKVLYVDNVSNLTGSTFIYTDPISNIKVTINGSDVHKTKDGYSAEIKGLGNSLFTTTNPSSKKFYMPDDDPSELISKVLDVPTSKFDFRLKEILPCNTSKSLKSSFVKTERILNRLENIKENK